MNKSNELYETTGANKVGEKIGHIREDAQEAWETSQNPWVYRASFPHESVFQGRAEAGEVGDGVGSGSQLSFTK